VDANLRDTKGRTPLFHAAERGCEGIVKLLINTPGVDIISRDTIGPTALSYAALGGHENVVAQLLNTGKSDINSQDWVHGHTPLSIAMQFKQPSVVKLLLRQPGIDISICPRSGAMSGLQAAKEGHTLLNWVEATGNTEMRRLLVLHTIDLQIRYPPRSE
jgi:ankyrin repeat protein